MKISAGAIIAALTIAAPAMAVTVPVSSYAMPNGGTGSYAYWDLAYNGSGSTSTTGAALSGGTGDLTDGVIALGPWYAVENNSGTGPYVGWVGGGATLNPVITFNFTGSPTITSLSLHIDNSTAGGVYAPASILIDGIGTAFTAPPSGTIGWINITGLSLTGSSHTVQLNQVSGNWVFVSEVTFGSDVPEPASWAMMIAGFGLVGGALRRRRMVAV